MRTYTPQVAGSTRASGKTRVSGKLAMYLFGFIACSAVFLAFTTELKPKIQLILLPLVYYALWRLRIFGGRVPNAVFGLALAGLAAGLTTQLSYVGLARGAFVVAGGRQWDLNQDVKIYRDRLRKSLPSQPKALVGLHSNSIASQHDAQSLLSEYPRLGGVVWGSSRWMVVSLQKHASVSLARLPSGSAARALLSNHSWSDLRLVASVPNVGVSGGTDDVTVHFIGKLIPLWRDFSDVLDAGGGEGYFEVSVRSLSQMQARWSSRSHLALPMWMLGTWHLVRAIEGASIEGGELACALRNFELALGQFRARDNPGLMAALRNNYAIALVIKGEFSSARRELRKNALEQLAAASRGGRLGSEVMEIISANRKVILAPRR